MKRVMGAAVLATCLLAGCSRPGIPAETGLRMLTDPDGFVNVQSAATPEGLYEPVRDASGTSTHIFYTDYATATRQYLCADPACAHNTDACTGYIADAGELFGLFCQQESLYLYSKPADGAPTLYRAQRNGAGREPFLAFTADNAPRDGIAAGDGCWYYLNDRVQADGSCQTRLLRLDLTDKTTQTLAEFPADSDAVYYLAGTAADRLLIKKNSLSGSAPGEVWAWDPVGEELTTLLSCPEGLVCRAVDDTLVYWRQGGTELRGLDVAGGEDRVLYTGSILGEGTSLEVNGVFDHRLLVMVRRQTPMSQVDWDGLPDEARQEMTAYLEEHQAELEQQLGHAIDPADLPGVCAEMDRYSREHGGYGVTMNDWRFLAVDPAGETRELTLYRADDPYQPVTVMGENEEEFCVCTGTQEEPVTYYDTEGKPYAGRITRARTALISKEDFYAGQASYREIVQQ